jgi:tRNA (adenine57-N1/adenine58-N1)-methyltransferase catalytic subunit
LPPVEKRLMQYGDKVVVYFDPTIQSLVTLQQGKTFDCKFGNFHHANFVGQEFGSRIMSNSRSNYVYAMKPDRHLYTNTLTHRTQILYAADISFVIQNLSVRPGVVVVESGSHK